jgi:hypothetical protein
MAATKAGAIKMASKITIAVEAKKETAWPPPYIQNADKADGNWGWCRAEVTVKLSNGSRVFSGKAELPQWASRSAEDFIITSKFERMVSMALAQALREQRESR